MQDRITHVTRPKPISELLNLYSGKQLNLEPEFQRQSVWSLNDRRKLMDSIFRGYPLPAVFFYRRQVNGRIIFDVIDGKQRLESIFMFVGAMRGRYEVRTQALGDTAADWINWQRLTRRKQPHQITSYEVNVIEVDGNLGEIIDLFVRINSTGKPLSKQEKAHDASTRNAAMLRQGHDRAFGAGWKSAKAGPATLDEVLGDSRFLESSLAG